MIGLALSLVEVARARRRRRLAALARLAEARARIDATVRRLEQTDRTHAPAP
jgi:hypothetical protein